MCRDAVAAPRALQLIVYPISLKKSLLFCEKIEKIKLFFVKRSKAKIAQERKLFRMASKMPVQDPHPHRSEFCCGRGLGQPS